MAHIKITTKLRYMFSLIFFISSISLVSLTNVSATISSPDWIENQEIIYSYKDTFVFRNVSDANYGDRDNFIVGNLTEYNLVNGTGTDFCEAYFFFNLRQILSLERISSITFSFYGESLNNENMAIEVYTVTTLWDELTITWNNKPAVNAFIDIVYVDVLSVYEFNITQEAQRKNSISIALRAPSSDVYFRGDTSESNSLNKPRLLVNYLTESTTVVGTNGDIISTLLIGALSLVGIIFVASLIGGRTKSKQTPKKRKKPKPTTVSGMQSKLVSLQSEITQMRNQQDDFLFQAKQAESKNNYQLASELYGKCKDLALKLFKYGVKGQSDLIKKFTALENRFIINQEFGQLGQMLDGITGEQFSNKLQTITNMIIERKGKSSIIKNLKRWIEDYNTKSNILSDYDKGQIVKAIDFWKLF